MVQSYAFFLKNTSPNYIFRPIMHFFWLWNTFFAKIIWLVIKNVLTLPYTFWKLDVEKTKIKSRDNEKEGVERRKNICRPNHLKQPILDRWREWVEERWVSDTDWPKSRTISAENPRKAITLKLSQRVRLTPKHCASRSHHVAHSQQQTWLQPSLHCRSNWQSDYSTATMSI